MREERPAPISMVPCAKCGAPSDYQFIGGSFCAYCWPLAYNELADVTKRLIDEAVWRERWQLIAANDALGNALHRERHAMAEIKRLKMELGAR